jgi:hypothetical protein
MLRVLARVLKVPSSYRIEHHFSPQIDIVLTVTVENGHLYVRENDEERQEKYLAESTSGENGMLSFGVVV